ncbi:MAG: protease modulator HflC [Nanoarchaeota archaeon]|nr:protease modulator HflC [Nanoarchaeota archaeon]MBU4086986.1 protease modulator HflC [Nanoarchaeota archaeon]
MRSNQKETREEKPEEKKKPNMLWAAAKGAIGALTLLVASGSMYTVDQTEQAVVTQFGRPVRVIINPVDSHDRDKKVGELKARYAKDRISCSVGAGLRFKIPIIHSVDKQERRLLRWNGFPEQIPTKDKKYIWVDTTARWYIEDPLQYSRSVGTEQQAQAKLDDVVDATTRNSITKRDLIEIVRTDNRPMAVATEELRETTKVGEISEGREKIVQEVTAFSRDACKEYGMGIFESGVLIKGLVYVQGVKNSVEKRMVEERLQIAKKYTSEGNGEYKRIMGDKERELKTIASGAYKEAQLIKGQADAEATRIFAVGFREKDEKTGQQITYKGLGSNPEFYRFWKTLQLYEESLGGKTRLILGMDNPLMQFMKGQNASADYTAKAASQPVEAVK